MKTFEPDILPNISGVVGIAHCALTSCLFRYCGFKHSLISPDGLYAITIGHSHSDGEVSLTITPWSNSLSSSFFNLPLRLLGTNLGGTAFGLALALRTNSTGSPTLPSPVNTSL